MRIGSLCPFSGVIFDLDGTLLDSMGVWAEIDTDFLGRRGFAVPPDYMEAITPLGFQATAEYTIARFGLSETPEQLMEEWNAMSRERYHHQVPLKPGAAELLKRLGSLGVPMAVASALNPELAMPCLVRNGVADMFSAMVTVDRPQLGKQYPAIWRLAAERIGVPPEKCLAVDDVAAALLGARAAGMATVGVYDPHSGGREALEKASSLVVSNLDEILNQLIV